MGKFVYRTQLECELEFIRAHRNHMVRLQGNEWLRCDTCGIPLHFTERRATDVLHEEFGR